MVSSFVLPEEISQGCSSPKEQLLVLLLAKLLKSRHTWASWNLTFSIKKGWSQDHWPCRKRREVRDSWALPFSCSLRCYWRNVHDLQWRTMPGITLPPALVSMAPARSLAPGKACSPLSYTPAITAGAPRNSYLRCKHHEQLQQVPAPPCPFWKLVH